MEPLLKDKIIVVSGGAAGTAAAICKAIKEAGGIPVIIDDKPGAFYTVMSDLTDIQQCKRAIEKVGEKFLRIDGLVNASIRDAGIDLVNGDPVRFRRSTEACAMACYSLTHHALPLLSEVNGIIVNLISKSYLTGRGGSSGYAAANGLLRGLTCGWAEELGPLGIRVNGVVVQEPDLESSLAKHRSDSILEQMSYQGNCATAIVMLLNPESTAYNGELIFLEGVDSGNTGDRKEGDRRYPF
jgi:L-fucose dehydrogenase